MQDAVSFFSFNKAADWAKGTTANIESDDGGLRLTQVERFGWVKNIRLSDLEGPRVILDMALSDDRKLFLLDQNANLWRFDDVNDHLDLLFRADDVNDHLDQLVRADDKLFSEQAKIAMAPSVLFVADLDGRLKLSAYSLSNGQLIWSRDEWNFTPLVPLAMVTDDKNQLYVLVPTPLVLGQTTQNLAVLKLNAAGKVLFVYQHDELAVDVQTPLQPKEQRFFLTVGADQNLYVLDGLMRKLQTFSPNGEVVGQLSLLISFVPSGLAMDANGSFYVSDSRNVEPDGEDTRFVLQYDADVTFVSNVAGYRGKTDKLLVANNRMYIWNALEQMVTVLEMKPRIKLLPQTGRYEGVMLFRSLDSTVSETIWHKITLDADFPDETQLRVSYYASDRRDAFLNGQYEVIDEYISNPDRSMQEKLNGMERLLWSKPIVSPHDALLFEAQGRYLWLKIEMVGSEKSSPLVRRLRAYFPRTSYLDYLPGVYQEDPTSRDFLERFLSLFGTFMNEMEDRVTQIPRYFDGDSVSGDYLRWLGTWLGIAADDTWTEEQTQQVLKRAPELYKKRGTRQGLEAMIEIFTGEKPFIVEFFQYKQLIEKSEIKEYMAQLYGLDPYCFCVLVKPERVPTEKDRLLVQRILDEEKPAFAEAKLVVLEPWMYMGTHSYIGVNTFLSEPSLMVLDDKSSMPYQTLLIDVDRDHRLGLHTRLELDSELE